MRAWGQLRNKWAQSTHLATTKQSPHAPKLFRSPLTLPKGTSHLSRASSPSPFLWMRYSARKAVGLLTRPLSILGYVHRTIAITGPYYGCDKLPFAKRVYVMMSEWPVFVICSCASSTVHVQCSVRHESCVRKSIEGPVEREAQYLQYPAENADMCASITTTVQYVTGPRSYKA